MPAKGVEERRKVERIDAAVDLANLPHLWRCVAFLHDPGDAALRADDPPVAVRAFHNRP